MSFNKEMTAVSSNLIDVMGEAATYTPFGGGPESINVIFDAEQFSFDPYSDGDDLNTPRALAKTTDVPGAKHKDELVIGLVTYEVVKAEPDNTAITALTLNKIRTD